MIRRHFHGTLIAVACCVALAAPSTGQAADAQAQHTAGNSAGTLYQPASSSEEFLARGQNTYRSDFVARFGWWGVGTRGDIEQVGEWDSLRSSPFWDFDGLRSDGNRTLDLSLNGTEQDANSARASLYLGPKLNVTLGYERFLHRLDNETNLDTFNRVIPGLSTAPGQYFENATWDDTAPPIFTQVSPDPNPATVSRQILGQDLNVGQDAAVRVQELNVRLKGEITEHLKWRLNLWGMRKEGERQSLGTGHCFNGTQAAPGHPTVNLVAGARACHSVSRLQRIDWTTMQIEPMLIGRWGPLTATYSHKLKALEQNDELLLRNYTATSTGLPPGYIRVLGSTSAATPNFWDYAFVPENIHNIDRLRLGLDIDESNKAYANLFIGNTHNSYRETNRQYSGWDVRLNNDAIENVSLTGYAKQYKEQNDGIPPPRAVPTHVVDANRLPGETDAQVIDRLTRGAGPVGSGTGSDELYPSDPTHIYYRDTGDGPNGNGWRVERWDYDRRSVGLDGQWRPFGGGGNLEGLSFTGGYDHTDFLRENTLVPTEHLDLSQPPPGEFVEIGSTFYDTLSAGVQMRWSPQFDTYVRYKRVWIRNPLFAVHMANERENTSLPTDVDLVEFGGTWFPAHNFLLTATIGIENRFNSGNLRPDFGDGQQRPGFQEDDYPITFSAWWAPTCKLSLTGGLGFYSNWIDQGIIFGDQHGGYQGDTGNLETGGARRFFLFPLTERIRYGGRATVLSLGANYAWTERIRLLGGFDWTGNANAFDTSATLWPEMGSLSDVFIHTTRFTAGVDWRLAHRITAYGRYIYYEWQDDSKDTDSGASHAVLGGLSALF